MDKKTKDKRTEVITEWESSNVLGKVQTKKDTQKLIEKILEVGPTIYNVKKTQMLLGQIAKKILKERELHSSFDLFHIISQSREGISYTNFELIRNKLNLNNNEWCKILSISDRTFQRYKKESKSFDSLQSERIYQIALLYNLGANVFNSEKKFLSWLDRKNIPLGQIKPKAILDTSFGIELLKTELQRIEHGILA